MVSWVFAESWACGREKRRSWRFGSGVSVVVSSLLARVNMF